MRRLPLLVLVVGLTSALSLRADEPPPPAAAALTQSTEVLGMPPDLKGRWFVVADLALPDGNHLSVTHFWEIATVDGKLRLDSRQVSLPVATRKLMEEANSKHVTWKVTDADVATVRDEWATLPPEDRGLSSLENRIIDKDGFDEMIKNEELMQNALWVIQQTGEFRPNEGRPVREVLLWGALEATSDGYSGNHMSVAVAAAPFPIPIAFKGTFRMYRVDPGTQRGLLARLLDVFAGCGRTR